MDNLRSQLSHGPMDHKGTFEGEEVGGWINTFLCRYFNRIPNGVL